MQHQFWTLFTTQSKCIDELFFFYLSQHIFRAFSQEDFVNTADCEKQQAGWSECVKLNFLKCQVEPKDVCNFLDEWSADLKNYLLGSGCLSFLPLAMHAVHKTSLMPLNLRTYTRLVDQWNWMTTCDKTVYETLLTVITIVCWMKKVHSQTLLNTVVLQCHWKMS